MQTQPLLNPVPSITRAEIFALENSFDRPTVVLDPAAVEENYWALKHGLGDARLHYAVKANPQSEFLERLVQIGCSFDAASRGEIELCLAAGAKASNISFGNTVKKVSDIRFAFEKGVRLFAADGHEELEKIAAHAPGAKVYIRLLVHNSQADWPLSRKFGCDHETALELMSLARDLGLRPVGLSFHVGSQTRHASMWGPVLHAVSQTWFAAKEAGFDLTLLNIGGGFPAYYGDAVQHVSEYAPEVRAQIQEIFGDIPDLMAEPGRGLVATSGALACEVLLVSKKAASDLHRWVYLDVGRFSGLAETEGEAVRYQFLTPYGEGVAKGPSIMAGPSCDSTDVLYEKRPVMLPLDLKAGDKMVVRNAGSYTTTYSSVGFNGFPPLAVVVI